MSALGLGGYDSSDEDVTEQSAVPPASNAPRDNSKSHAQHMEWVPNGHTVPQDANQATIADQSDISTSCSRYGGLNGGTTSLAPTAVAGPAPGPAPQPDVDSETIPLPEPEDGSQSPYSSTRSQIRNLTMPPVPNFDIPPSPPGSPPLQSTAKINHFLDLKKQDVHFNERLLNSSALRNPGLLQNLMDFAQIGPEEQYMSSLPEDLAVRTTFPEWAYADKLVKAHDEIARKREKDQRGKRTGLDFVPAKGQSGTGKGKSKG